MHLENLPRDSYPEMVLGAAQDLLKEMERASATRTQSVARWSRLRERIVRALRIA